MMLPLEQIRLDGGTQLRVNGIDPKVVEEYAERMKAGDVFPAAIVYFDDQYYWLSEGFHRYAARELLGKRTIEVEVKYGTQQDAIDHAAGANATHGLPRTNKDKQNAVKVMLRAHTKWSDGKIAASCGVHQVMVLDWRQKLESAHEIHEAPIREGLDGVVKAVLNRDPIVRELTEDEKEAIRDEGRKEKLADIKRLRAELANVDRELTKTENKLRQAEKELESAAKALNNKQREVEVQTAEVKRLKNLPPTPYKQSEITAAETKLLRLQEEEKRKQKEWDERKKKQEFEEQWSTRQTMQEHVRTDWVNAMISLHQHMGTLIGSLPSHTDLNWFNDSDWRRLEETKQLVLSIVSEIEGLQRAEPIEQYDAVGQVTEIRMIEAG